MTRVLVALLADRLVPDLDQAAASLHRFSDPSVELTRMVLVGAGAEPTWPITWRSALPCGRGALRSIAIEAAHRREVDFLLLLRPAGTFPENLVRALVLAARADDSVAIASPWRTDLAAFGLPREERRDGYVLTEDEVSRSLEATFGAAGLDVPLATEECALISMRHLPEVGRLDVALDDVGCWDWALRARRAGLRAILVPGSLLHRHDLDGRGEADQRDELVLRSRFPLLPVQLDAVTSSGAVARLRTEAVVSLARTTARSKGWYLDPVTSTSTAVVVRTVGENGACVEVDGFRTTVDVSLRDPVAFLTQLIGRPPIGAQAGREACP